jgi:hypothetical protein
MCLFNENYLGVIQKCRVTENVCVCVRAVYLSQRFKAYSSFQCLAQSIMYVPHLLVGHLKQNADITLILHSLPAEVLIYFFPEVHASTWEIKYLLTDNTLHVHY